MRTKLIAFLVGFVASLLVVAIVTSDLNAQTDPGRLEYDIDRPGNDYRNFDLSSNDPRECHAACSRDGRCVAFTFVRPGVQGREARCWLKDAAGAQVRSDCCVSGLLNGRLPQPTNYSGPAMTDNMDRPGGDYRTFVPIYNDAEVCRSACFRDLRCRAWTFVRRGFPSASPRCWLKTIVPVPVRSNCCVSGVPSGMEPGIDRPGWDMFSLPMPTGDAATCRNLCIRYSDCRAFTYVRAGLQGPQPRCWLKREQPAAVPNDCCTSGIVR